MEFNKLVYHVYPSYKTPASYYPIKKVGSAEINRIKQREGFYWMEGVCGYAFYYVHKYINVTELKIHGETVMVDDPLHWMGMAELARNSGGNVLVGGLGLGLIVYSLRINPHVKKIDVVEINEDVIKLIAPLLPKSKRIRIFHDNIYEFENSQTEYNTVILDLWVKSEDEDGRPMVTEMLASYAKFKVKYPKARIFIWGIGDSTINPAVNSEVRRMIEDFRRKTYKS